MLFGYESDGRLLGLVRFREDHGTYWIEDLIVDETKRATGIGSQILAWAEDWVKSRGARPLFLDVVPANLEALDFFLRHGYDYLNILELRKNFYDTPPKAEVTLLGRRFRIHSWPAEKPLPRGR
jgi:GNAT superfamily N-acetyltransferase